MQTKKELKKAYKQIEHPTGVYRIRNSTNHKVYVDSSSNLNAVWNRHRAQLKFGDHRNKALQMDWNELGEQNFTYEILATIDQNGQRTSNIATDLATLKALYLEELQPYGEKGYNQRKK